LVTQKLGIHTNTNLKQKGKRNMYEPEYKKLPCNCGCCPFGANNAEQCKNNCGIGKE
jgi:hypothetical protein